MRKIDKICNKCLNISYTCIIIAKCTIYDILDDFYQWFIFALSSNQLITVFNCFPSSPISLSAFLFISARAPALPYSLTHTYTLFVLYNTRCKQITLWCVEPTNLTWLNVTQRSHSPLVTPARGMMGRVGRRGVLWEMPRAISHSIAHFIKISSLSAPQNARNTARREPWPAVCLCGSIGRWYQHFQGSYLERGGGGRR